MATMEAIIARLMAQSSAPSRGDIAELLASVGKPGEKREEKDAAVKRLFEESGHRILNFQGHSMIDTLDSYKEY